MKRTIAFSIIGSVLILAGARFTSAQTTTDPTNCHAYGANVGWMNAAGDGAHGLTVAQNVCGGYIYSPTIGWICMGDGTPANGIHYGNTAADDYGVNLGERGELVGNAYSANTGWLTFEQTFGMPRVDVYSGRLSGYVWAGNLGWIALETAQGSVRVLAMLTGDDEDGDSLPDWWEYQFYGQTNAPEGDADLDADADGLVNWEEWRAGTDPNDPASTFEVSRLDAPSGSVSQIAITWPSAYGKSYAVTAASSLNGTWTTLASRIEAHPPMNTYTVTVETLAGYWRVLVE